jgi:hypothetical protein
MLSWIRRRLALRRYRRRLGPALVRRYGRERHYTINQVRATVDTLGLDTSYVCYAFAAFCEQAAFEAHHAALGEVCDWATMHHAATAHHVVDYSGVDHSFDHEIGDHLGDFHHHPGHDGHHH